MNIIVVGCGRVGAELAHRLFEKGHHVTVVDAVASAFDSLDPEFRGRTLEGDVLSQDMLRRAGIEQADGIAAVTNSDTLNSVIGHIARTVYHVSNVVTRCYEPRWRPLYEAFGLQTVGPSSWGAQRIEEMLADASLHSVFSAGNGEVEVYELAVPEIWLGRSLSELLAGSECIAVSVTRAGRAMLPSANAALERGDVVHLSATLEGIEALRSRLPWPEEA
jgi:trk system potassium uptake protein